MDISAEQLEQLIICHKFITTPPKKTMIEKNQCRRNNFKVHSTENEFSFNVFMRQSLILPEDFSVILQWQTYEHGPIIIFRCNGPHGGNKSIDTHFVPHTHRLNIEDAQTDYFRENDTQQTQEYTTFEGAISYFCLYCGINNAEKYFPYINQQSLF